MDRHDTEMTDLEKQDSIQSMTVERDSSYTTVVPQNSPQVEQQNPAQNSSDKFQPQFKVCIFRGNTDSKLRIRCWLQFYENQAALFEWNEQKKKNYIGQFLEDEALDFYVNHCSDPALSWSRICSSLIS